MLILSLRPHSMLVRRFLWILYNYTIISPIYLHIFVLYKCVCTLRLPEHSDKIDRAFDCGKKTTLYVAFFAGLTVNTKFNVVCAVFIIII